MAQLLKSKRTKFKWSPCSYAEKLSYIGRKQKWRWLLYQQWIWELQLILETNSFTPSSKPILSAKAITDKIGLLLRVQEELFFIKKRTWDDASLLAGCLNRECERRGHDHMDQANQRIGIWCEKMSPGGFCSPDQKRLPTWHVFCHKTELYCKKNPRADN